MVPADDDPLFEAPHPAVIFTVIAPIDGPSCEIHGTTDEILRCWEASQITYKTWQDNMIAMSWSCPSSQGACLSFFTCFVNDPFSMHMSLLRLQLRKNRMKQTRQRYCLHLYTVVSLSGHCMIRMCTHTWTHIADKTQSLSSTQSEVRQGERLKYDWTSYMSACICIM